MAFVFSKKNADGAARFFSLGPRDVRDGRWSDGRRARGWSRLASRSRTEDRKTLRDGRWSEGWVGAGTHVNRRRPMSACARRRLAGYVASHLGHRCTSHSQAPWRHGSNDAYGRSHVAIATAQSEGFSAGSRDGQSMVRGLARGAWLGPPAGAVSLRGRDRPARAASGVRASGRSNGR